MNTVKNKFLENLTSDTLKNINAISKLTLKGMPVYLMIGTVYAMTVLDHIYNNDEHIKILPLKVIKTLSKPILENVDNIFLGSVIGLLSLAAILVCLNDSGPTIHSAKGQSEDN